MEKGQDETKIVVFFSVFLFFFFFYFLLPYFSPLVFSLPLLFFFFPLEHYFIIECKYYLCSIELDGANSCMRKFQGVNTKIFFFYDETWSKISFFNGKKNMNSFVYWIRRFHHLPQNFPSIFLFFFHFASIFCIPAAIKFST